MKTYLAEYMNEQDLNPTKLSEMTGIPARMIANYVSGKPTPSLENAKIMADVLGITVDELITGKEETNMENILKHLSVAFSSENTKVVSTDDYLFAKCLSVYLQDMKVETQTLVYGDHYHVCYLRKEALSVKKLKAISHSKFLKNKVFKEAKKLNNKYDGMKWI